MTNTASPSLRALSRWLVRFSTAAALILSLYSTAGAVDLFDDFERADSGSLGNGWIEKSANAFTLVNGDAAKQTVSTGYIDNIVYRPASEDLLDQEASIELDWLLGSIGYPQVFVRVQSATAAQAGNLDGYMLYMNGSANQAILGRQTGGSFVTTLATLNLSSALNTTDRFRLRLRATGTSPVELSAWVERFDGNVWQVIGQANASDSAANRIATVGAVGFGGYIENTYRYDNFQRLDLDGGGGSTPNPAPVATTVTPDNANAGSGNLTITIEGTDFLPSSTVRWNGSNRNTTFVSATQLDADITAADLSATGNTTLTVYNPTPGGGDSAPLAFTINPAIGNPVPQTTVMNPTNTVEGSSAFLLTVTGNGFIASSIVRWNGADRTTTFISDTQLQATIPDTDIAIAGIAAVSVFTPAPGGGTSNSQTFTIDPVVAGNPVPAIGSLLPTNVTEGDPGFILTVTGADFVPTSVIRLNGSDRATTYISNSQLDAVISAADIAAAGNASVTVFSPTPGGGVSNTLTLTIDPSGPTSTQNINSISPNSAIVGDAGATLTVNGNGFTALSDVQVDGIVLPTTFISTTQLTATMDASLLAENVRSAVMVYTPEATNTLVGPVPFFVLDAGDTLFVDDFNRPDGATIGNQWTEKLPSAFSLQNGLVTSVDTTPRPFNESIVYRPPAQDGANVEAAVEFIRTGTFERYPQVHTRVSRDTVGLASRLNSYVAFLFDNDPQYLTITPTVDSTECYNAQFPLTRETVIGERYRIRFRTLGTNPVRLTAYLDHFNVDRWETISAGTVLHDTNTQPTPGYFCNIGYMPQPYTNSGAVGFAKWFYSSDNYDSFYSIRLANDSNAAPIASSLAPATAPTGGAPMTVTVNGSDFVPSAVARWNGSDRPTTFINSTTLDMQISAADLSVAGTVNVTAFNPAPGGGESAALVFTIGSAGGGSDLYDNFNRPNGTTIGNGWIENSPNAFLLVNGQVDKQANGTGYLENLVYRPAAEDVLDMEVSMQMQLTPTNIGFPQIYARIQSATVSPGTVDGYLMYLNNSETEVIIGRQLGSSFLTSLATFNLSPSLIGMDPSTVYRMRLRVTGANPVTIEGIFEMQTTSGWQILGQTTTTDSSAERISTAGSVGFSGYVYSDYTYDNFLRSNISQ